MPSVEIKISIAHLSSKLELPTILFTYQRLQKNRWTEKFTRFRFESYFTEQINYRLEPLKEEQKVLDLKTCLNKIFKKKLFIKQCRD